MLTYGKGFVYWLREQRVRIPRLSIGFVAERSKDWWFTTWFTGEDTLLLPKITVVFFKHVHKNVFNVVNYIHVVIQYNLIKFRFFCWSPLQLCKDRWNILVSLLCFLLCWGRMARPANAFLRPKQLDAKKREKERERKKELLHCKANLVNPSDVRAACNYTFFGKPFFAFWNQNSTSLNSCFAFSNNIGLSNLMVKQGFLYEIWDEERKIVLLSSAKYLVYRIRYISKYRTCKSTASSVCIIQ